ncbi:MAG: Hsp70 family protein, partial [Traorella sp.]
EMKEALNLLRNGNEIDIKDDKTEVIGEDNLEDIYKYLNKINTEKPERKEEKSEQEDKKKYEVELESIIEYVVDNFEKKEGINLKEDSLAMTRIKEASIKAKKVLEKEGSYQMEIQYIAISQTGPKHLNMTIHIQSVLNYKQFTNAKSNNSNQSFKQSHVKEDRQLEPLQIKCPKCGKISYYMFRHGYRCPSCGHIFLTDINDDKGLKLKELLLKVAQSDPNDKMNIIEYYKQMIEIAPDSAQIYYRIGLNYDALNEEERAIKHYKKALSLDDRDASFYHSLGVVDINNGNYQSALKYFDKAYDLIINDSYTLSDLKGLFYANYAVLMEETNQSERAFHFLKKARENGFNQCTNKIKYFDVGVEYTGKKVKEILEKHSYQLSWSNKNFFVDPIAARTSEQLRSFNIHEKDDPYLYISPSLISFSGNIKRGSGIFEGIVLCKKAFYFLSSKNPKGYFEMMYFNLADYDISYKNKKIIIKNILIDNGVRKDAIIHTGADGKIVVLMLQEIQNFFKK